ncbi:prolipoprotein diacylglyceryl transferase [Candidatus Babela massiliensis]|uniref:Phosphatidylglycerol--prolipoprotein diacylglyceryl transferase n=1 Tax=Candidatus Babela massiliensis TaxID=673862 RepID=V6DG52_9BACT|nr:prolipoprotein diacylglyceryl transferase [Candidatus Babela massiliensis]CDK30577.1 Prolipoprotein diacylglyceryltransferase [Candidatus Babela massiliensis]
MYPVIFNIYGPIKLNSFSVAISISIIVFLWLIRRDKSVTNLISKEDIINLTSETAIIAIIGGRALHVINNFKHYNNIIEIISIWNGGLAVLGSIIAGLIYLAVTLKKKNIKILYALDIISVYIPIVHSISRIGCFLAGCCYGQVCNPSQLWAVTYRDPESIAPLELALHPTQIYSSLTFLFIFIFMQFLYSRYKLKQGTLLTIYLMLSSLERISIDFLRGDRDIIIKNIIYSQDISKAQLLAIFILIVAFLSFIIIRLTKNKIEHHEPI